MSTTKAAGPFDVTMSPDPHYEALEGGIVLGRVAFTKIFHGDLDATSVVQMLSAGGSVKGSAGYVAIERVTGSLHGRAGSFVLQHSGSMNRGATSLTVTVVPDTGTEDLCHLSGTMTIDIIGGKHFYAFEYALGVSPPAPILTASGEDQKVPVSPNPRAPIGASATSVFPRRR